MTPGGGSHTHSPVVRLAYMCSLLRGSIISTHSHLQNTDITQLISMISTKIRFLKKSCITPPIHSYQIININIHYSYKYQISYDQHLTIISKNFRYQTSKNIDNKLSISMSKNIRYLKTNVVHVHLNMYIRYTICTFTNLKKNQLNKRANK